MNDDTDYTMVFSILELIYPRVMNRILLFWGHADIEEVLNDLIIMDQPGRIGFSSQAIDEIMFLQSLVTEDKSIPRNFSFG